jgi:perosamine synthetase
MIAHSKPYITESDKEAVLQQLESGMLAEGNGVARFEAAVGDYLNNGKCIATSSGVTALSLAYKALGLGNGDEVIIPSYVCESVAASIQQAGATPVLCDIGDAWCMNYDTIKGRITKRTKAIVLVHIFGINAWDDRLKEFGVPIIEDNCQAFGYESNGMPARLTGDMAVYSYHATKCLATGEGGMLSTANEKLWERASAFKKAGDPFCRMTDLQAALGLSQLKNYSGMKAKRKEIARYYLENLNPSLTGTILKTAGRNIYFRFLLTLNRGTVDDTIRFLDGKGIAARKGVDALLHRKMKKSDYGFEQAVTCFESTLSIPIYPSLKKEQYAYITEIINTRFHA